MSAAGHGQNGGPESDGAHSQDTGKRRYRRWTEEDARRWKEAFESGKSILEVAAADEVDPKLVSQRLHRLGVEIYQRQAQGGAATSEDFARAGGASQQGT